MIWILHHFTYKDYIKFIHNIKQNEYFKFNESTEKYSILQDNNDKKQYRNIIEYLFKDKRRIAIFIKDIVHNKNIEVKENLEYVEFVKEKNRMRVIYKKANRNLFYLIVYQKEINFRLPYHVLNDCTKIIQKQNKENIEKLTIIPIVIYFQCKKYIANKTIQHYFEMTTYDNHILELKYNVINLLDRSNTDKINNTILEELIYLEGLNQSFSLK